MRGASLLPVGVALLVGACTSPSGGAPSSASTGPSQGAPLSSAPAPATSASGAAEGVVGITILAEGTGPTARPGDKVAVHYTASLTDGTQFASSRDKNEPLVFTIGGRGIVKGMSLGVSGMKVGEKRRLVVPPSLAYGERSSTTIPANSTLVYEVELLGIQPK